MMPLRTSTLRLPLRTVDKPRNLGTVRSCSQWPIRAYGKRAIFIGKRVGVGVFKLLNFVIAAHLFATHVGRASTMSGPSMLPTLALNGEIVIEDVITYKLFPNKLARGDLVTVESPIEPRKYICKRLIGLPGDIVCVDPTGEQFLSTEHVVVPKGHIWISGDNAAASRDSRTYGPVPIALVKGRVIARIWPLRSFKIFTNQITHIE